MERSSLLQLDQKNHLKTCLEFQQKLADLIRSSLFEIGDVTHESGGVLALYDHNNTASLMLSILPFSEINISQHPKKVIIFITQTDQPQRLAEDYLQQKYKLAKREIEVCNLFVNGMDLEQIGTHMKITYGTVRMYIKNIFAKTACSSQTELMQLLMGLTLDFEHI